MDYIGKIKEPPIHFYGVWSNWFDYLSIDTSNWIQCKNEWKRYCKNLNISNVEKYNRIAKTDNNLPLEPKQFYEEVKNQNFTTIINELELNDDSYLFE